jgi:hypothetical protein
VPLFVVGRHVEYCLLHRCSRRARVLPSPMPIAAIQGPAARQAGTVVPHADMQAVPGCARQKDRWSPPQSFAVPWRMAFLEQRCSRNGNRRGQRFGVRLDLHLSRSA